MEGSKLGLLISRALQLIFGAIVLGVAAQLSVDFNKQKHNCDTINDNHGYCDKDFVNGVLSKPQPSIEYAAFTGAFGILGALVTLAAVFVDAIPWIVSLGFDGLASIFYLAGGINNAVQRAQDDLFDSWVSGGTQIDTRWDTTTAFMFLAFLATLGALVLVFLSRRSGGVRHSAV